MKDFKPILCLIFIVLLSFSSCRTEDDLAIDPPSEEAIQTNAQVTILMRSVALNDGSVDNIIDNANCLSLQFPVTVTVNGNTVVIDDVDDLDEIEDIFDEFDDDIDELEIMFPVIVVLADYTKIEINSEEELENLAEDCSGENEDDDDIECIDFEYPITFSVFNQNNDLIDFIEINNDSDLYDILEDLDDYAAVTINFPIEVVYPDGTGESINSIQELENAIELADDTCDEDDDFDYDDDDCNDCTSELITAFVTGCSEWSIDGLERDDEELEENYEDYKFTFNTDNSLVVDWDDETIAGTWSVSGSGNNITFEINIPGFDDINDNWYVEEIESDGDEKELSLRIGDEDELEFEAENCN